MIDVTKTGERVQLFRAHGFNAYGWLLTANEAHDLMLKLQRALCEPAREPAETLADE